jgi:Tfp pilus assembly protein FimT
VVIIVAIAAAMIIPQALDSSSFQALSAARVICGDLEYARDLAITSSTPVTVTFDTVGNTYTLTNTSGNLIHPITKATPYTVNFGAMKGFARVDVLTAAFGSNARVTFDETGAPDNAGTVTLVAGPHSYRIDVAAATGKVTVTGS